MYIHKKLAAATTTKFFQNFLPITVFYLHTTTYTKWTLRLQLLLLRSSRFWVEPVPEVVSPRSELSSWRTLPEPLSETSRAQSERTTSCACFFKPFVTDSCLSFTSSIYLSVRELVQELNSFSSLFCSHETFTNQKSVNVVLRFVGFYIFRRGDAR